jgi:hypothetical protein
MITNRRIAGLAGTAEEKFKVQSSKFKQRNQFQERKLSDFCFPWFIGLNFGVGLNFGF